MYLNSKRSEKILRYQNICDMNSIPLGMQQIRIPVYQIIGHGTFHFIPHPSCTDFTKKPTQTEKISWYLNSLQLASAMENLKHIFTAPEIVRKTEELISEGKLLQAHKQYVC